MNNIMHVAFVCGALLILSLACFFSAKAAQKKYREQNLKRTGSSLFGLTVSSTTKSVALQLAYQSQGKTAKVFFWLSGIMLAAAVVMLAWILFQLPIF